MSTTAPPIPAVGQIVRCRGRAWLVDGIEPSPHGTVLALSCLEDDSQGEQARVIWEAELGTSIIDEEAWRSIGSKNGARAFDDTRFFSAFYRTLRWNCVTATDPKLFQSPFRAGIRVEPYQLAGLTAPTGRDNGDNSDNDDGADTHPKGNDDSSGPDDGGGNPSNGNGPSRRSPCGPEPAGHRKKPPNAMRSDPLRDRCFRMMPIPDAPAFRSRPKKNRCLAAVIADEPWWDLPTGPLRPRLPVP